MSIQLVVIKCIPESIFIFITGNLYLFIFSLPCCSTPSSDLLFTKTYVDAVSSSFLNQVRKADTRVDKSNTKIELGNLCWKDSGNVFLVP